ncbi:alpha/beta hydrolase [Salinibacterium sedimenticola]|uniref:alpha/beta hydrolase n=1 Tax=Homoserinimonas sedimenticola TaxID=2986805 RepID=UPI0022369220|nr:alpha/beta hydrolase-fold protein [Salinibacterium sedimenticola]
MAEALEIDDAVVAWSEPRDVLGERPLVVLLHGRGSHEHDLMQLAPMLLPDAVYASLRAPLPFLGGGGYSWFPPAAPGLPSAEGAEAATRAILAWLDRVAPAGPVAVLGFSQGGALATHLMRFSPERFVAFVNLSGFIVPGVCPADATLPQVRPPMFWGRDLDDPIIPSEATEATEAWLPGHCTLTRRRYSGVGHGISIEEVAEVRDFLAQAFAGR